MQLVANSWEVDREGINTGLSEGRTGQQGYS